MRQFLPVAVSSVGKAGRSSRPHLLASQVTRAHLRLWAAACLRIKGGGRGGRRPSCRLDPQRNASGAAEPSLRSALSGSDSSSELSLPETWSVRSSSGSCVSVFLAQRCAGRGGVMLMEGGKIPFWGCRLFLNVHTGMFLHPLLIRYFSPAKPPVNSHSGILALLPVPCFEGLASPSR